MTLRILALNIANPSPTRALLQLAWLRERPEDVLVLSETKNSKGSAQLLVGLQEAGWVVVASAPGVDGYGVAVASRVALRRDDDPLTSGPRSADLGGRALSVLLALHQATGLRNEPDSIRLVAAYGPTSPPQGVRQRSDRTARKQAWLTAFSAALSDLADQPLVVAGDLNVVDRGHLPNYRCFTEAEYAFMDSLESQHHLVDAYRSSLEHDAPPQDGHSWVHHNGDGYRYDHVFVADELAPRLHGCGYLHETRLTKLSDHSAMYVELELDPVRAGLPVA
jgi:exodeoxyribonuclease-3